MWLGGVTLKGVKVLLRVMAALVLLFGLYLIFFQKQFLGIFLIIGSFLILPSLEARKENSNGDKVPPNSCGDEKTPKAVRSDSGSN
jgi:hypothetical protein